MTAKKTAHKRAARKASRKSTASGPKSSRNRIVHRSPKSGTISRSDARDAIHRYLKKTPA